MRPLVWSALFVTATLATAFAIAWMLSGRIVRPLRQLRRDAIALAAGDLNHRSVVRTDDEVGMLAGTFNQMAARLEQRQEKARRAADDLRQTKDTLATVIDASPVAIVCSDLDRRIFLWNRSAEEIFGYTAEEAAGQRANLLPPKGTDQSQGMFERASKGETLRNLRLRRKRKDGSLVDVRRRRSRCIIPMEPCAAWRAPTRTSPATCAPKSSSSASPLRPAHRAAQPALAAEGTRAAALRRGVRATDHVALFDLDGFKDVNDTLGHSTGDQLLIEVGQRLTDTAGSACAVCRLGGDEFVVVVPAAAIRSPSARLSTPCSSGWRNPTRSTTTCSMSAAAPALIAPGDGGSVDELIANADLALYQAKSRAGAPTASSSRCCGRRRRPGAALTSNCGVPSPRMNSSCTSSRRSGSPTAPWSVPRRCCAGATRRAASLAPAPLSIRLPPARSPRR
jgi:diguanylate cyclase (GGDEF)-like protein/PAS domain S-box-containing protein